MEQRSFAVHREASEPFAVPGCDSHGDMVVRILSLHGTYDTLTVLDIFGSEREAEPESLLQALRYVHDQRFPIVNVSCGTIDSDFRVDLDACCAMMATAGQVVICSATPQPYYSYPACLESVIGIYKSDECHCLFGLSDDEAYDFSTRLGSSAGAALMTSLATHLYREVGEFDGSQFRKHISRLIERIYPDDEIPDILGRLHSNSWRRCRGTGPEDTKCARTSVGK